VTRWWLAAAAAAALAAPVFAYPITEERKLGEQFAVEAASQLPLLREPAVVDYVSTIGQRIVAKLDAPQPFEYRFSVVNDDSLNAFAVPGGFIYVNSGLLLRAGNDSELAGVLGHEIGHSHAHHIVRQQEKTTLMSYAALAGMLLSIIQPAIGAAAMGASATAQLQYQREFEQEADYLGIRYMRAAGFDPHGMTSFMKRLWEEQRTMPLDQMPPYMMSHPLTDERITNLEAATRNIPQQPGWQKPSFGLQRAQAIVLALSRDPAVLDRYAKAAAGGNPRAVALHGVVMLYQGDAAGALAKLESAKAAGLREVDDDIALARFRSGDFDGALRLLRARAEEAPDDATAQSLLGQVLLAQKDYAGSARALQRASDSAPGIDQVEYDLGQAYGRSGDPGRGLYHLARALELRGDVEQARAQYEKAAKQLAPDSAEAQIAQQRVERLSEFSRHRILGH